MGITLIDFLIGAGFGFLLVYISLFWILIDISNKTYFILSILEVIAGATLSVFVGFGAPIGLFASSFIGMGIIILTTFIYYVRSFNED